MEHLTNHCSIGNERANDLGGESFPIFITLIVTLVFIDSEKLLKKNFTPRFIGLAKRRTKNHYK